MEAHRMRCADCDQEIDCFDWILRMVSKWDQLIDRGRALEKKAKAAQERLDELLRKERNAKARLKRL
jgi:hypothetical protein